MFAFALIRPLAGWLVLSLLGGVLIGLGVGTNEATELQNYSYFQGENVAITGRISEDVAIAGSDQQRFRIDNIEIEGMPMGGEIWLSTSSRFELKRGDIIKANGNLGQGFGNIPASIHRAEIESVQRPEHGDIGRVARDWFASKIRDAISEPQASLGVSYLSGHRRALPDSLSEQLRILGLTHLVVASGFHLTIVVRFMRRLFAKVSKYLATSMSIIFIGMFLLITGFSTSMTRAAIVTTLSILAWYYGRKLHPLILLSFVAGLTAILHPPHLWGDVGWVLSFSAFAGVIILAPLINRYFWSGEKEPSYFRHLFVATTAAQLATFPVIAYSFGEYSYLALISNLLMMPFVPIAMLLTFITGILQSLVPIAASIISLPTYYLLAYMTELAEYLAGLSWSHNEISLGFGGAIMCYLFLIILTIYLRNKTGYALREANVVK